jgi:hypothetical protein
VGYLHYGIGRGEGRGYNHDIRGFCLFQLSNLRTCISVHVFLPSVLDHCWAAGYGGELSRSWPSSGISVSYT